MSNSRTAYKICIVRKANIAYTGLLLNPEESGICFFSSISEEFSLTKLLSTSFSDTCGSVWVKKTG